MQWINKFDLFLFDLDGLLVDTERLHFQAYQQLCLRYDTQLPWDYVQYLGVAHSGADGLQRALTPLFADLAWEKLYKEKKQIYIDLLNGNNIQLMPGVESLLKQLAQSGSKRCVVTHSSKEQVGAIQHRLPLLKTIPVWITREDYEQPKPSPDGYLRALSLLRDPQDKVIGFEDSLRGFLSLQQTDALPVLICHPNHPQMEDEQLAQAIHFPSFSQIKKI